MSSIPSCLRNPLVFLFGFSSFLIPARFNIASRFFSSHLLYGSRNSVVHNQRIRHVLNTRHTLIGSSWFASFQLASLSVNGHLGGKGHCWHNHLQFRALYRSQQGSLAIVQCSWNNSSASSSHLVGLHLFSTEDRVLWQIPN